MPASIPARACASLLVSLSTLALACSSSDPAAGGADAGAGAPDVGVSVEGGTPGVDAGACAELPSMPSVASFAPDLTAVVRVDHDDHAVYVSSHQALYAVDAASPAPVKLLDQPAPRFWPLASDLLVYGVPSFHRVPKAGGAATDVPMPPDPVEGLSTAAGDTFLYFSVGGGTDAVFHAYDLASSAQTDLGSVPAPRGGQEVRRLAVAGSDLVIGWQETSGGPVALKRAPLAGGGVTDVAITSSVPLLDLLAVVGADAYFLAGDPAGAVRSFARAPVAGGDAVMLGDLPGGEVPVWQTDVAQGVPGGVVLAGLETFYFVPDGATTATPFACFHAPRGASASGFAAIGGRVWLARELDDDNGNVVGSDLVALDRP